MSKTAMQEFIEWGNQMIGDYPSNKLNFYEAIDKAEELLEVEKEQIVEAYKEGMDYTTDQNIKEAEQYYQKTYGGKDNE